MLRQLYVVLCCLSTASGTYVAYLPNSLIPGIPLKFRVLVQNSGGPVSVCAGLKFANNDSVVAEKSISMNSGMYSSISINVPSTLLPSNYRAFITGSGALVFTNSSSIHYNDRSLMVFIQTDKVRYSAGQTVRYRAVFLLPNLMGFQGEATVIIQDGQDHKIETRGPHLIKNGVISGEIELSKYPVFGNWTIGIDVMGRTHTKYFEVNEYVKQRFTVELSIPPTINTTQEIFVIGVMASFTFKADVNGKCTIQLYNEGKTSRKFQLSNNIKGSAEFIIQMAKLTLELDINKNINVRGMVTDNATALTMVAERRLKIASNKPHPITITKINAYENTYIPGITYRTKIFVGRNGKSLGRSGQLEVNPDVVTAILLDCDNHTEGILDTIRRKPFIIHFNESGYSDLAYLDNTKNVQEISFYITLQDAIIQRTIAHKTFVIYPISDHTPFLRMNVNKFRAKVGERIVIDVSATENLNGALTFEVYARGMHLISERVAINDAMTTTHYMPVTKDMIPNAFITVNHLTQIGQLIADYVYIQVEGNPFENKVELSFNDSQPQPGETVNMHVSADPLSTIYVLAGDLRNHVFGVDNDIYWKDVVQEIVDAGQSLMQNIGNHGNRKKRAYHIRQLPKRSIGDPGNLQDTYIESGLIVLSDATVFGKEQNLLTIKGRKEECYKTPVSSLIKVVCESCPKRNVFEALSVLPKDDRESDPGSSLEEIVRTRFPDTWLWDEYDIGMNGAIDIAHKIPDSMTLWVTSVFAVNPGTGFGIAETKPKMIVKKKFFLTMDLPPSIVHGEEFLLQISVFNNYPINKLVFLRITLSENPDNPLPASTEVKGNDGQSTFIRIQPEKIGELNITVTAYIMGSFVFTIPDQIRKSVTVRPNGVFKTTNEQHLIDVTPESSQVIKHIEIVHPDDMVDNSRFTKVIITGNFMVPVITGLDNLIQMPHDCGEQAMMRFAPAIFIHDYLTTVGKLTPEIKMKSMKILKT
ncbi:CD109 antigen-like, partial [Ruditapes philippinarum]|uniref:CD109 antigen-like n=1 Tax=Ruditapes philippinarum TaxID=129788 RepID=UPI00295AD254